MEETLELSLISLQHRIPYLTRLDRGDGSKPNRPKLSVGEPQRHLQRSKVGIELGKLYDVE